MALGLSVKVPLLFNADDFNIADFLFPSPITTIPALSSIPPSSSPLSTSPSPTISSMPPSASMRRKTSHATRDFGPNSSPKRSLGKSLLKRKAYGFLPGAVRQTMKLPAIEITIPEILTFLPDHIHRAAVAARLVANRYTGKMVADLINYSRGLDIDSDSAIKGNTVTKIITNTLATALGRKDWRRNEACMAKVRQVGAAITTRTWDLKYSPKGAGGLPLDIKEIDVPFTDLYADVDPDRWPVGSSESWLTACLHHVKDELEADPNSQIPMVSDLPAIILRLRQQNPEASTMYDLDEERVHCNDENMVNFWKSEKKGMFKGHSKKRKADELEDEY